MKTTEELRTAYEQMFGEDMKQGIDRVKLLIRRTVSMGSFESGFDWTDFLGLGMPETTIDDRDFLRVAFFAMHGIDSVAFIKLKPPPPKAANVGDVVGYMDSIGVVRCVRCQDTTRPNVYTSIYRGTNGANFPCVVCKITLEQVK